MKIGILGRISPEIMMALQSSRGLDGIEFVEVTNEHIEERKINMAMAIEAKIAHFESEDFTDKATRTTYSFNGAGKSGNNKSDRKRNRKNRWR